MALLMQNLRDGNRKQKSGNMRQKRYFLMLATTRVLIYRLFNGFTRFLNTLLDVPSSWQLQNKVNLHFLCWRPFEVSFLMNLHDKHGNISTTNMEISVNILVKYFQGNWGKCITNSSREILGKSTFLQTKRLSERHCQKSWLNVLNTERLIVRTEYLMYSIVSREKHRVLAYEVLLLA